MSNTAQHPPIDKKKDFIVDISLFIFMTIFFTIAIFIYNSYFNADEDARMIESEYIEKTKKTTGQMSAPEANLKRIIANNYENQLIGVPENQIPDIEDTVELSKKKHLNHL